MDPCEEEEEDGNYPYEKDNTKALRKLVVKVSLPEISPLVHYFTCIGVSIGYTLAVSGRMC